ncbi:hypothetical protein ASE86_03825 [Sphingomonas sp. Leaf33]|uniref:hypothetical protein n=1 Tax=Sphingomonas sp. Leaf33 TaxID=1736215 RepID=UPI000701ED4C|nr:hypothetical protein [Sphingomonas sp. Leaf33]KQN25380.1 hypothetical protein ASE86_03825 [Sphingomonas sp. Leaf33]
MSTTRHIYNNTGVAWQIWLDGGNLQDLPGTPPGEGVTSGTLPGKTTCAMELVSPNGSIGLKSEASGNQWNYGYSTGEFSTTPSWDHNGDTNGCSLNDPADCDFQINQDVPQ